MVKIYLKKKIFFPENGTINNFQLIDNDDILAEF